MVQLLLISIFILAFIGFITVLYLITEVIKNATLYDIEVQKLLDYKLDNWKIYIKHYKILGFKFKTKSKPFENYDAILELEIINLNNKKVESYLKTSLRPIEKND